jgi:TetR/AcrR family transcriptional repressor of nem operon
MRRSREEAARTREKIVEVAAALFRADGIDAVSVADVMGEVGLTVGGFYKHFESKDALVAEAIERAAIESTLDGRAGIDAAIGGYLSWAHRQHPERGCPVAALCSEVGHASAGTKRAFTLALDLLIAHVAALTPGTTRRQHLHAVAAIVGGLALARGTKDKKLAKEILGAVTAGVLASISR